MSSQVLITTNILLDVVKNARRYRLKHGLHQLVLLAALGVLEFIGDLLLYQVSDRRLILDVN